MGEPTFVPSPEIAHAVAFAAEHHGAQTRKGTSIPYLHHLLGVASIALEFGATETETVAAILHDVLEDTPVDEEMLYEAFGDEVTGIVVSCSAETNTGAEDPVDSWRIRKQAYLDHLADAAPSAVLVSLADKIHNARSISADRRRAPSEEAFWARFNAGHHDQLWYYRALLEMYEARADDEDRRIDREMVSELRGAIESFAGEAA